MRGYSQEVRSIVGVVIGLALGAAVILIILHVMVEMWKKSTGLS